MKRIDPCDSCGALSCGAGSGGAKVAVTSGEQTLEFTVVETGHFQNFVPVTIGTLRFPAGQNSIVVMPKSKPGAAVMDLRRVVLRPKS